MHHQKTVVLPSQIQELMLLFGMIFFFIIIEIIKIFESF